MSFLTPLLAALPLLALQASSVQVGEPATVRVWNRDVVQLRAMINTVSAEDRARSVEDRIEGLPETALYEEVETELFQLGGTQALAVTVGSHGILTFFTEDLDPLGKETLGQAGERISARLREVLDARAAQRNLPLLAKGIAVTVGSGLVLALVLFVLLRLRRRLVSWIEGRARGVKQLEVGAVDLRGQITGLVSSVLRVVAVVLGALAVYVWLGLSLAQFPYTAPWGAALGGWIGDTAESMVLGAVAALPGLCIVVVIFLIARGLVRMTRALLEGIERKRITVDWLTPETARATRRMIGLVIWVFALVFAYPYMPGSGSEAFKGISVLLGLMVSLGSAGLVNQIMSGFVVLYSRSVSTGEQVRIGDVEGVVSELGMLTTKVVTPAGEEVTIPNAVVVTSTTDNFSRRARSGGAVATVTVTIGYDTPWRQVHGLLLLAAKRTPGVRTDPGPRVVQRALADFYVEYQLVTQVEPAARRAPILSDLRGAVLDAFNEHGVQILSPHFVGQPESAVVVPREQWYAEPAAPDAAPEASGGDRLR